MNVVSERLEADERPIALIFLINDIRVLKMVLELGCPLDPRVAHLANLGRIKLVPLVVVKFLVKLLDEFGMDEIDESVTHIAVVLSLRINTL